MEYKEYVNELIRSADFEFLTELVFREIKANGTKKIQNTEHGEYIYLNTEENINIAMEGKSPSEIVRNTSMGKYIREDTFFIYGKNTFIESFNSEKMEYYIDREFFAELLSEKGYFSYEYSIFIEENYYFEENEETH